ncbi:MAG: response regulator transcription factor [Gammaproteobacteria bacterium]
MTEKILIIEDSEDLAELVALNLRDLSYHVEIALDGTNGLKLSTENEYNLVILDLMLPGIDGMEICRQLRGQKNYTPILMLTSKSSEIDRVVGFEIGADDYVVKPFSVQELMARIKAILRRMRVIEIAVEEDDKHLIKRKNMLIDLEKRLVSIKEKPIELTAREFELLTCFAKSPGKVFSRTQLLDQVWGYGYSGYEHTVNSHINRLRVKIEDDPGEPGYIETVWGVGYRYAEQ